MSPLHGPKQNPLLAALRAEDYARLLPDLEFTPVPLGWVGYDAVPPMEYVYFPTTCIVSLLYVMENGDSAEIAIIGNDGLVGVSVFMGGDSMSNRAVVQNAGECYRITGKLQKDGLISYGSGRVTVLNRPKLEDRVCECYAVVKNEIDRLFAYKLP